LIGVLLAVVATPFVPAGVPVLIALVGVAAALGNREQAEMAAS
jgi:hypothetical protein